MIRFNHFRLISSFLQSRTFEVQAPHSTVSIFTYLVLCWFVWMRIKEVNLKWRSQKQTWINLLLLLFVLRKFIRNLYSREKNDQFWNRSKAFECRSKSPAHINILPKTYPHSFNHTEKTPCECCSLVSCYFALSTLHCFISQSQLRNEQKREVL